MANKIVYILKEAINFAAQFLTKIFIDMKKILFVMAILPFFFASCSSDDDGDNAEGLEFVQIQVTSEDTPTPNGNVYLFKVSGHEIEDDNPLFWDWGKMAYIPTLSYKSNGESKSMLPISEYGKESKGDLLMNNDKGCSLETFYWDDLSSLYGTPKAGDEYLVFVALRNGTYAKASKRFVLTKNSIIRVKLPSCTDEAKFVNANWSISDYK